MGERLADLHLLQRDWDALEAVSPPGASEDEIAYERAHWDLHRGRFAEEGGAAWKGEPFSGKTLLVHWEQGLGDSLMFLRYLPKVKALGGAVLLVVQPSLLDLAATCGGGDVLRPFGAPDPEPDARLPDVAAPPLRNG